ncbi:MAG: type II toxin-antitoxin system HicA family toxin [Deltaproteobacteria bacterium]|nr:type II toxin-antitoxin system HicA family toxin [Deltaproteobacteria bacterium]
MSKKLPAISGKKLISCLIAMGYQVVRQRGSHVRLEKSTEAGVHKITIPNHDPIAKGTLNDILTKVSIWNQMPKDKLVEQL